MKKIANIDERLATLKDKDTTEMPTVREMLLVIGNIKADTADNARRSRRIILKLKDKSPDLILENDDMAFLVKLVEQNQMGYFAWVHGQMLDKIDGAETVEVPQKG